MAGNGRAVARYLGKIAGVVARNNAAAKIIEAAVWFNEYYPYVSAYFDGPKDIVTLQRDASTPARGYEKHHIVEQTPARSEGFSTELIEGSDNLVRIPTLKHWEITGWFATKSERFGGQAPREYLRGKSWEERMRVGREALVERGVLKP